MERTDLVKLRLMTVECDELRREKTTVPDPFEVQSDDQFIIFDKILQFVEGDHILNP